jgi:hypothetical protein
VLFDGTKARNHRSFVCFLISLVGLNLSLFEAADLKFGTWFLDLSETQMVYPVDMIFGPFITSQRSESLSSRMAPLFGLRGRCRLGPRGRSCGVHLQCFLPHEFAYCKFPNFRVHIFFLNKVISHISIYIYTHTRTYIL